MQTSKFIDNTIKYVIFDMDGVLVDSAGVTQNAARHALAEIGIDASLVDFTPYIGTGEKNFILGPCRDFGKSELAEGAITRFYQLFEHHVNHELTVFPDVISTIHTLQAMNIPMAIASSSARSKLNATLAAARINTEWFDVIISGDEVSETKPSPLIYMTAIRNLYAKPENCLVVEDAISGIIAAKRANAMCFAVSTSFPASRLKEAGADYTGNSIFEIINTINKKAGEIDA